MKNTCRSLLFFKGIFNGRVDDQHIVAAFNKPSASAPVADAASTGSSSGSSSSAVAIRKHAQRPTVAVPAALSGSAFVFPYGKDCAGTVTAGADNKSVSVEGTFKRLLNVGTAGPADRLAFFHEGRLYSAATPIAAHASGSVQHTFAAPTTAALVAGSTAATDAAAAMEATVREANVYIAMQASSAIYNLAVTAARHTSSVAEYDQYLCHSQTMQRHLSIIETSRYALDSLALSADAEDSPLLAVFARSALERSVTAANAIFGSFVAENPKIATRRHPSDLANDAVVVDYSSLARATALLDALTASAGATDADIGHYALGDMFGKDSQKVKPVSLFSKNPLHLAPTHNHAAAFVTAVETELAAFPSAVLKAVNPKSRLQAKKAAEIAAELLATVAVLHRFSAAVTADLEHEGRSQASLVPTFCLLSSARRAEALGTLTALKNAGKSAPMEVDDASVHPSHL